MRAVHCFDNGVKVYDDQLVDAQRLRYAKSNVHEEDEEELFLRMINSLPAGGIFVSVGSAIGYYAFLAKRCRPDLMIHCFEPLEKHRSFLSENIALNGFLESDFKIHRFAIAPSSDEYLLVNRSFGSFLVKPEDARSRPVSSVESVLLSEIGTLIGSDVIDLLQMDIQGFEALILEDHFSEPGSKIDIRSFLVGTHGESIHDRCRAVLGLHGYMVLHDEFATPNQPDGILAAAKGDGRRS